MVSIQELDNSLEYLRSRGLTVHDAALYVWCKGFLGTPISQPELIIDLWNNAQQADGSWLAGGSMTDMFVTNRVLGGYYLLNSTPQKSLAPFMSNYDTYQEALNYIALHDSRNIYHVVFGWCLYYWKYPPWLNDVFAYIEQNLAWTTGDDYHKTSHILYSYVLGRRQIPNLDNLIAKAVSLQQADGSFPIILPSRPVYSTSIMISMLKQIQLLYPSHLPTEIQNALDNTVNWVNSSYRTTVYGGKTLGYFGNVLDMENALLCGVLSAGQNGLLESNVDMTYADIVQRIQQPSATIPLLLLVLGLGSLSYYLLKT